MNHIAAHYPTPINCETRAVRLLDTLPSPSPIPFDYGSHARPLSGVTEREWLCSARRPHVMQFFLGNHTLFFLPTRLLSLCLENKFFFSLLRPQQ
jgi:hypothetical protein